MGSAHLISVYIQPGRTDHCRTNNFDDGYTANVDVEVDGDGCWSRPPSRGDGRQPFRPAVRMYRRSTRCATTQGFSDSIAPADDAGTEVT